MCKLESTKWIVVKSNKKISKNLALKLGKIRSASVLENRIYFWNLKPELKKEVLEILKSYKYQKFEICEFYDKQFGLSLNFWRGGNEQKFNELVKKMPLSKKFYWNNENSEIKTVTPITKKQFDDIIYIN